MERLVRQAHRSAEIMASLTMDLDRILNSEADGLSSTVRDQLRLGRERLEIAGNALERELDNADLSPRLISPLVAYGLAVVAQASLAVLSGGAEGLATNQIEQYQERTVEAEDSLKRLDDCIYWVEVDETTQTSQTGTPEAGSRLDDVSSLQDLLALNLDSLDEKYTTGSRLSGLGTGYLDLDDMIGGLQPSKLYVVASGPTVGSTSFVLGIAANVSMRDRQSVLFFSLQIGGQELSQRILAAESLVDQSSIRWAHIDEQSWNRMNHGLGRLAEVPMAIDGGARVLADITNRLEQASHDESDLGLVVVDGIRQLEESTEAEAASHLRALARRFEIPILATTVPNLHFEQRVDKRPTLSDLDSEIQLVADTVMFLYRDEVYDDHSPDKGIAEVIVAKNRSGLTGRAKLAFRGTYGRFDNLAHSIPTTEPEPADPSPDS